MEPELEQHDAPYEVKKKQELEESRKRLAEALIAWGDAVRSKREERAAELEARVEEEKYREEQEAQRYRSRVRIVVDEE